MTCECSYHSLVKEIENSNVYMYQHLSPCLVKNKNNTTGVTMFYLNEQEDEEGKPYHCKHSFTCQSQLNEFKSVLEKMATRPEEYITLEGPNTNNIPEGYHGIALAYRGKRIDLGSVHYQCKTNMSIPHKVTVPTVHHYISCQ